MSDDGHLFSRFATSVADLSGKPSTFMAAVVVVLLWAVAGPFFGFSDTWELVINTGTTIITFLMVFVLQNSENRDGKAMQAKLDELILASKARNEYVGIEKMDEQELKSPERPPGPIRARGWPVIVITCQFAEPPPPPACLWRREILPLRFERERASLTGPLRSL
ncbi:low affinity iron permease family protein [Ensifer sp. ENS07]|nr:low affinity iron permease family protein [Ensifer sp. ENS07]